jgi:hypothetical protein
MLSRQIAFLSLVSLTIGVILWRHGKGLFSKWKKSEATVIKNVCVPNELALFQPINPDDDETATYYPVVEFKTDKAETITKQLDIGGYPARRIGERIKVIYDPNKPTDFVTNPQTTLRATPLILMIAGAIGLVVSLMQEIFAIGSE